MRFFAHFLIWIGLVWPAVAEVPANFRPEHLAAWCIVPFDAAKRSPEERAEMLKRLGIGRCAYDWRQEHVQEFEREILAYKEHGIEMFAFWSGHEEAYRLFRKYDLHPQIWRTLGSPSEGTREEMIEAAADSMETLARQTADLDCPLGLYNHGGWGGEPENLVAVCRRLRERGHDHVGIVYNWHHGHGHIEDWARSLDLMKPYLLCLNLNGMNAGASPKILTLSQGEHERSMLKTLADSGYDGPVGIIDHRNEMDSEVALRQNLEGLHWLLQEIEQPGSGGTKSETPASKSADAETKSLFPREPLEPDPYWEEEINRDRLYDFYAKQARKYGRMEPAGLPDVLPEFPGLDGGSYGHWGNQNDQDTWKDGRVRDMDHGSMVSGVFRGVGHVLPRAVSVALGDGANVVFDQESLSFVVAWKGDLVEWSDVRRGFMKGIPMGGEETLPLENLPNPPEGSHYRGLYRAGDKVVFAFETEGEAKFRAAAFVDGKVVVSDAAEPSPGAAQWPERLETVGSLGEGSPYAIDTLTLPYENPWNALFFVAGVDFLSAQRIAICTIHGDVWICDTSGPDLSNLVWKRFAGGLHQPLGLKVVDGVAHVMCRDQIVALHDRNGDGEADFYECVSNAHEASQGGHDFITGLQRDGAGRWYFASGNQGVCRVSADGRNLEVLGTGLRNPNGLGISPDGSVILTSVQEGTWTPASAICDISLGGHFGAGGPKDGPRGYVPPMLYLPRGVDNSSGGQAYIDSERWGSAQGNWVHFSGGFAKAFLLLRETIEGESQAAAIPLPGTFMSGCHRGRFSPYDGQLYVAGAQGWGNYGVADGCLQRMRYSAENYPYPVKYETRENGVLLTFGEPPAEDVFVRENWFAQQWNYLYAPAYGSPEFSVYHPDRTGHDHVEIRSVQRLDGGRKLFLEIPQLQPVNQLHLHCDSGPRLEFFATVHRLGEPFSDYPGYEKIEKRLLTHAPAPDRGSAALIAACTACHHPTQRVVGPPFAEIRKTYAGNPDGIVKWAMAPENKNPELPPMPKFDFMGEEKLREIAEWILSGK